MPSPSSVKLWKNGEKCAIRRAKPERDRRFKSPPLHQRVTANRRFDPPMTTTQLFNFGWRIRTPFLTPPRFFIAASASVPAWVARFIHSGIPTGLEAVHGPAVPASTLVGRSRTEGRTTVEFYQPEAHACLGGIRDAGRSFRPILARGWMRRRDESFGPVRLAHRARGSRRGMAFGR